MFRHKPKNVDAGETARTHDEDDNREWLEDLREFSDRDFGEEEDEADRRRDPLRQTI